ncbi:MAG: TatD family hydrolase [Acidobacteriota bacterium]|nr:TatD family hydrolase [Acidobacteriota bacterium]
MVAGESVGLIDSHCHLQSIDPAALEQLLDAAREAGVRGFLAPAITLADSERLLDLCHTHADIWCAVGVHPHEAKTWSSGDDLRLRNLLDEPKVIAVGECGLDFHYDYSPREMQLSVMKSQWEIAIDADVPVVVHNRNSNETMLAALREPGFHCLQGVFHSFAGGEVLAREILRRGFRLGFSGMVTFPAAANVRDILPLTPLERLLVETDTPYLAPVPHRGRENRPEYVVEIARRIARELDIPCKDLFATTTANFFALFRRSGRAAPDDGSSTLS